MILNFSHPLSGAVFEALEDAGYGRHKEHRFPVHLDLDMPLIPQIDDVLVPALELLYDDWVSDVHEDVFVVLPGYSLAAAIVYYRLFEICGQVWFSVLHLTRREDTGVWDLGEIIGPPIHPTGRLAQICETIWTQPDILDWMLDQGMDLVGGMSRG